MEKLYNYTIWYNHYENIWYGIPRDLFLEFFASENHKKIKGIVQADTVNTLIAVLTK